MSQQYYHVKDGVIQNQTLNLKKIIIGLGTIVGLLSAAAIPAFAASDSYCGSSANGCVQSSSHTACSGHGAFGAFGKDNSFAGGASGDRTAYSNSTLCGNPSPNSSAATLGDVPTH